MKPKAYWQLIWHFTIWQAFFAYMRREARWPEV